MTNIKLITVTSHPEHAEVLKRSAEKHGWDFVCIHVPEWKGFGTKLIETYNYLNAHPEVERFVFADAFDVVVLSNEGEFMDKTEGLDDLILVGTEKGLWPPPLHAFRSKYIESGSPFNYINSGLYYSRSEVFISLFEKYTPNYDHDDQLWMNLCYLLEPEIFKLDYFQTVFNNHSFISDGEYGYENGRIQILGNQSIFSHKNGKTIDEKLDSLIK